MKPYLTAGLILLAIPAVAENRTYDLSDFVKVEVSDGVRSVVTVGEDFAVEAEARRGDLDRLNVDQYGDRLVISRKQSWGLWSPGKRDRFEVTISMPEVFEIESNSGSTLTVKGAGQSLTSAQSSSGATLSLENADLENIEMVSSSGATLNASGNCSHIEAQSTSGSTLSAADLSCETAEFSTSSGATLRGYASKSAILSASSGASLSLIGGAAVTEQSVSSGASLSAN